MHKIKKIIFNIGLPVFIIGGLLFYLNENKSTFVKAFDASWYQINSLIFLVLLTWVINNFQTLILLRSVGIKINFFENLTALVAMILGNYLPGRFGSLLRMQYFKKVHGLEYSKFGGIVGLRIVLLFVLTGVLGSIGLIGNGIANSDYNLPLLVCFLLMLIISVSIFLFPTPPKRQTDKRILKLWYNFLSGFEAIKTNKFIFRKLTLLVLLQFLVVSLRLYIVFDIIDVNISYWILLMMGPMTTLISFLNITPGNLGMREWAIGTISVISGINFQGGIFAGTIDRAVLMACTFLFGSFSLLYIVLKMKNLDPDRSHK